MPVRDIWQQIKNNLWALAIIVPSIIAMIGGIFTGGIMYERLSHQVEQNKEQIHTHKEKADTKFDNLEQEISVNKQLLNEFREFRAEQQQNLKNMSENIDRIRERLNKRD
jgi:peptidoglycan hydrolase CwlO-like protein